MRMTLRTFAFPEESLDYQKAEATIRTVLEVCEFAARNALESDQVHYREGGVEMRGYLRAPQQGMLEMVINARDGNGEQKLILHYADGTEFFVNEQSNGARWEVLRDSRSGTIHYTEELPE